jgi:hypothetical protein
MSEEGNEEEHTTGGVGDSPVKRTSLGRQKKKKKETVELHAASHDELNHNEVQKKKKKSTTTTRKKGNQRKSKSVGQASEANGSRSKRK